MIKNGFKLSATDSYCSDLFPQYAGYCEPKVRCNLYFVREIVLGLSRKKFKLFLRRLYREFVLILKSHACLHTIR